MFISTRLAMFCVYVVSLVTRHKFLCAYVKMAAAVCVTLLVLPKAGTGASLLAMANNNAGIQLLCDGVSAHSVWWCGHVASKEGEIDVS